MRLSARARRLEREVATTLPDPDAFTHGLEKMLRCVGALEPPQPIEFDEYGVSKPRPRPVVEPLTAAERRALEAEGCDTLAGLMGLAMRQEDEQCD